MKEKAIELVEKFLDIENKYGETTGYTQAKKCALICVDEIIKQEPHQPNYYTDTLGYWQEVKQEINKL